MASFTLTQNMEPALGLGVAGTTGAGAAYLEEGLSRSHLFTWSLGGLDANTLRKCDDDQFTTKPL